MAAPASSWSRLGDALGGDSELAYQEGLALGAKTENALATAREKVDKSKAQMRAEEDMVAAGVPRAQARAASTMQVAGGNYKDLGDMLAAQQEYDFRNDAAGVTGLDFATGNRRAMGFASGPVDRFQKVGNGFDDRFDAAGVQPLPGGAQDGGGMAAQLQVLRAYGLIGPDGRVIPGQEAKAFDVMRSTDRTVDLGGVPGVVSANPFSPTRGAATPTTPVQTVTDNVAATERSKKLGAAAAEARQALPSVLADIDKFDKSIEAFTSAPGFDAVYGNIQGQPGIRTALGVADQDIADAQAQLGNLSSQAFMVSVQKMRGLGPLSNAEGLKAENAYTKATDPTLGQDAARQAWADVRESLKRARAAAAYEAMLGLPNDAPPPNPGLPVAKPQPVEARISSDAEYDALPSGTTFVGPDGQRRVKP